MEDNGGNIDPSQGSDTSVKNDHIVESNYKFPIMSIYRIKMNIEEDDFKITKSKIKEIIVQTNDSLKQKEKNEYELMKIKNSNCGMKFVLYRQLQKDYIDQVFKAMDASDDEKSGKNHCIVFCAFPKGLYALVSGNGWQAVRKFADYDFPFDIANKILSPNGAKAYTERYPLGLNTERQTTPNQYVDLETLDEMSVITKFVAVISDEVIIPGLDLKDVSVEVSPGRFKVRKMLTRDEVSKLIRFLDNKYQCEVTDRKTFSSNLQKETTELQNDMNKDLAKSIIKSIVGRDGYNWVKDLNITHNYLTDWTCANKVLLFANKEYLLREDFTIRDIINKVHHNIISHDNLALWIDAITENPIRKLQSIKIQFKKCADSKDFKCEPLIYFIQGRVIFNCESGNRSVFRINKMWYYISGDFIVNIERRFRKFLQDSLLGSNEEAESAEWKLGETWEKTNGNLIREENYVEKYRGKENTWIGDQKLFLGIELCDIGKYNNNAETYLYHVKATFGQTTRDCCSQMRNALMKLNNLSMTTPIETGLRADSELREYAKSVGLEYTKLVEYFGTNSAQNPHKLTFVYGVQTHHNLTKIEDLSNVPLSKGEANMKRSLFNETKKCFIIKKCIIVDFILLNEEYKTKISIGMGIKAQDVQVLVNNLFDGLKNAKFLKETAGGEYEVTSKLLYHQNEAEFEVICIPGLSKRAKDACTNSIRKIFSRCITDFKSMLAKYELLITKKFFDTEGGNGDFKVCEILTENKKDGLEPKKGQNSQIDSSTDSGYQTHSASTSSQSNCSQGTISTGLSSSTLSQSPVSQATKKKNQSPAIQKFSQGMKPIFKKVSTPKLNNLSPIKNIATATFHPPRKPGLPENKKGTLKRKHVKEGSESESEEK